MLLTQPSIPNLHPVDVSETPASPLPHTRVGASIAARLGSESNLPWFRLTAADDALFGIYQDLVHQNTSTYLDGGIDEYGKWQAIWRELFCFLTQRYDLPSSRVRKVSFWHSMWSSKIYECRNLALNVRSYIDCINLHVESG